MSPEESGPITISPQKTGHSFAKAIASAVVLIIRMLAVDGLPQSAMATYQSHDSLADFAGTDQKHIGAEKPKVRQI
jgi:hypothetical protein